MDVQKALEYFKSGEYSDLTLAFSYTILGPENEYKSGKPFDIKLHKLIMKGHCEDTDYLIKNRDRLCYPGDLVGMAIAVCYMYSGEYNVAKAVETIPGLKDALNKSEATKIPPATDAQAQRRWLAESHMRVHRLSIGKTGINLPKVFRDAAKQELLACLEESGCFKKGGSDEDCEVLYSVLKLFFEQESFWVEESFETGLFYYKGWVDRSGGVIRAVMDRCVVALLDGGLNEKIIGMLAVFRPKILYEALNRSENQEALQWQRWRYSPNRTN